MGKYGIPVNTGLHTEVSDMCNLSKGVWEKGEAKGRMEGMLNSIRQLMQSMQWTAEQAMNALQIPQEERSQYLSMLEQA